jgi:ribonuclease HII
VNCQAGVDEAGLGPILGPLVVAGVAMAGPEGADPWRLLRGRVSRSRHAKGRIRVADSKKVNTGPHGLRHLEETVLTFWAARHGGLPATLAGWLGQLGVDVPALRRCPWYQDLEVPLPLCADRGWLELQSELLARSLDKAGLQVLQMALRPVDVEEWNGLIAETDNKSRAHFRAYAEVIGRLLTALPDRAHLVADRCGGRMHYGADLSALRPSASVQVVQEEPHCSVYRVREAGAAVTVTFAERAEDRAFPTALASCCAKYLRELMVHAINEWFAARVPGLQRTAGYFTDGHRFLQDLQPHWERLQVPQGLLVRVR